ncbi:MAG: hypothetical protein CVV41_01115 [Candidatus Riflebacteria bacterium HGW-Riflebacteria-1]|nr:MAG: hypothetical protein CVV41_01115 [Candidatus Riflebacteria bacterium HGW-Riflebacteria-1]
MANLNPTLDRQHQAAVELLGREPRTPFTIKTLCPDGTPQVLMADPVFKEDGVWKPFPAFLWLVCPRLKNLVADLEQKGQVREFSQKLSSDDDFKDKFLHGQNEIARLRVSMAEKIYPGELPEHIREILSTTTIAGSRDFKGVKCLHSHLAQELAFHNNPIGAEVLEQVKNCSKTDCCGKYNSIRSDL